MVSIGAVFYLLGSVPNSPTGCSLMLISLTGQAGCGNVTVSTSGFLISPTQPIGQNIINTIGALFTSESFLLTLGIGVISSLLLGGVSFAVIFIIPLFILAIFMNVIVLPATFVISGANGTGLTGDPFTDLMIGLLFNIFMLIGIISFIRGGQM